MNKLFIVDFRP